MNWLSDKASSAGDWVLDKASSPFMWATEWASEKAIEIQFKIATDLAELVEHFYNVFVIVAIIGVYFIMFGDKKTGTKITSLSFFSYLILRSVIGAYA